MKEIKKSLGSLGYEFREVGPSVILVKNFLNENDLIPVWEIIGSSSQADWEEDYRFSQEELAERLYGRRDLENLIEEGLMEYTYKWNDKSISLPPNISKKLSKPLETMFSFDKKFFAAPFTAIQRQYEGAGLVEHVDSDGDPHIKYAAIAYVNDDYNGGNLLFPKLNLKIKPEKHSLIIFPSSKLYLHGVEPPLAGPLRYVLPTFIF